MSGFEKPSSVVPYADQSGTVSSDGSDVWFWSSAPTVITNGSLPGAADMSTGPSPVPWLPDAATTTMPLSQRLSTAWSSGSYWKLVGEEPAIEKFATRMSYLSLLARIHPHAAITSLSSDSPLASAV